MCKSLYYHSVEELDSLSDQAVVYDQNNQVWQRHYSHPFDTMSTVGPSWYRPGSELPRPSTSLTLPVRLLDDGL